MTDALQSPRKLNKAAQALGRLAKGVGKRFSKDELVKRAERMKELNAKVRRGEIKRVLRRKVKGVTNV
jgi:hypothetical protein